MFYVKDLASTRKKQHIATITQYTYTRKDMYLKKIFKYC